MFKSHNAALDGTKVKALNSIERSYTKEYMKTSTEKAGKLIEKYMKEMDENDEKEGQGKEIDKSKVQEAIKKLNERKEKLEKLQDKMTESKMT